MASTAARVLRVRTARSGAALPGYAPRGGAGRDGGARGRRARAARDADRRGRHRHRQDLRLPRAGAAVGRRGDRLDRHARRCRTSSITATCPTVCGALGRPVRIALLKGRANYLCRHRLDLAEQQAYARGLRREVAPPSRRCVAWSHVTKRGDIARAARRSAKPIPSGRWVTSTRENCLGAECPVLRASASCSRRAREAQAADIVVVNHHLLMADLVLKEEGLRRPAAGVRRHRHRRGAPVAGHRGAVPRLQRQHAASSSAIAQRRRGRAAARAADGARAWTPRLTGARRAGGRRRSRATGRRRDARLEHAQWPERLLEALQRARGRAAGTRPSCAGAARGGAARARSSGCASGSSEDADRAAPLTAEDATGGVRWAETRRAQRAAAHYAPVGRRRPARRAARRLSRGAWILTSATLAVGDDFSHYKRRSGLARRAQRALREPVRLRQPGAAVPAARACGDPSAPGHTRGRGRRPRCRCSRRAAAAPSCCSRATARCARRARGTAPRLGRRAARCRCWCRATARATSCCARFREAGNAVLLGTGSFWEGVDVQGRGALGRDHRQAAVRGAGRPAAQGAPRRRSARRAATRSSTSRCRRPVISAEAGRRPPDPRRRPTAAW
ncbi:MAG: hypothetical protein MZV65_53590 [Chromatiales bacterium]|nr:hypothetical protein [Chromatiales bacterium]